MRTKLAMFLVLAGGVAGCSSSPPPPPMAMAPEPAPMAAPAPAPAPMASSGMNGMYRGSVEASADNGPRCRKMAPTASASVRGKNVTMGGMRAMVGNDGALMGGRRGPKVTGTLANGTIDATTMIGSCSYHYTLNKA